MKKQPLNWPVFIDFYRWVVEMQAAYATYSLRILLLITSCFLPCSVLADDVNSLYDLIDALDAQIESDLRDVRDLLNENDASLTDQTTQQSSPVSDLSEQTSSPMPIEVPEAQTIPASDFEPPPPPAPKNVYRSLLLSVEINKQSTGDVVQFLQEQASGALLVTELQLRLWRVKTQSQLAVLIGGSYYVDLSRFPGLTYELDDLNQGIHLRLPPESFVPTIIDFNPTSETSNTTESSWGGFMNYAFSGQRSLSDGKWGYGANFEMGVFAPIGVLVSTFTAIDTPSGVDVNRGTTTFFRDFPELLASLRVGDVFSRSATTWGTGYQLGGVQFGTNFTTRPGFSVSPTQLFDAITDYQASVFLEANQLALDGEVRGGQYLLNAKDVIPSGPIQLLNVPTFGNGEYRLVVRDSEGVQRVIKRRYFYSQGLLKPGLHDYNVSFGLIRRSGLGSSIKYDDWAFSAVDRFGITNHFTAELHLEAAENGVAAGAAGFYSLPYVGLMGATVANSWVEVAGQNLQGGFAALSLENRYGSFAYSLRHQITSRDFQSPGIEQSIGARIKSRTAVNLAGTLPWDDSLGVSYSESRLRTLPDYSNSISINYGLRLGYLNTLSLVAQYRLKPTPERAFFLTFSASFAQIYRALSGSSRYVSQQGGSEYSIFSPQRTQFSISANRGSDGPTAGDVSLNTSAVDDESTYSIQLGTGIQSDSARRANVFYGNQFVTATAGLVDTQQGTSYRLGFAGGAAFLGGGVHFSNQIRNALALVRLGENGAGFAVNGVIADDNGDALLLDLIPYRDNRIQLGGENLPLSFDVRSLRFNINPHFRSGVVKDFFIPVRSDVLIQVQLKTKDGVVPLPVGAIARLDGNDEVFPAGDDGLVYLIGVKQGSSIVIEWLGQQCNLVLELPDDISSEEIPELGPYICEGIKL